MAGDHHCPLCSATFTRPQHVGRHLRAHTGDRPYECKECPLKFARSDLLSRHVNKAHRPPGEGKPPPEKKPSGSSKARRQSLPASAMAPAIASTSTVKKENASKPAAAPRDKPRSASLNQAAFQAQQIYPHHPLLAGNMQQQPPPQPQPQTAQMPTWNTDHNHNFPVTAIPFAPGLVDPAQGTGNPNAILGHAAYPNPPIFDATYSTAPTDITGSERGFSTMDRGITTGGINYEWGYKKRACDQCNHSKVRCDFEVPCLRCTHRNLTCTYNKPQRSKTIAYPFVSGQTQSSSAGFTGSNTSVSPQFKLPSPHVGSSSAGPSNPNASSDRRKSSVASLPPNLTSHAAYPGVISSSMPWNSYPQVAGMQASTSTGPWPHASGYNPHPAGTSSGSVFGHLHDSPGHMTASLYPSGAVPAQSRDSASPQNNLAPTPALTSQTTSPSEIDEPAERRFSFNSISGSYMPPPRHTPVQQEKVAPTLQSHHGDPNSIYNDSSDFSPTSPQSMTIPSTTAPDVDPNHQYGFIQSNTIDPRWQARLSFSVDDGESSALSSSANSTYIDLNDAQAGGGHHRRRSSASTWANAMAHMSLQESNKNTGAAAFPLPEPYNAASDQSLTSQKRPTFPTLAGIVEGSEPSKIPSLSDVKDLWRLFMAEPMTGISPAGEKPDVWDNAPPPITPRPGLGKRTLSKSNSMPDLQSPLINGSAFFTNFMNGMTPQPTESQQSYIPPHTLQQGQSAATSTTDNPDVRKWSKEIQQRQSSFSLNSQPSAKVGKSPVESQSSTLPNHTMLPPAPSRAHNQGGRPLPSVMQHSSALQQTLAPERMPSFNMPHFTMDSYNSHQSQSSRHQFAVRDGQAHGFASNSTNANSRPGNKRLASQTLMGDAGKKSTFMLFDEENDNPGQGLVFGSSAQQHHPPTNINPALFAPSSSAFAPSFSLSGNTHDHSGQQQQQQHPQQKWASTTTIPIQSQNQQIPTQSTSMFHPNWALASTVPGNLTVTQPEAGPMSL